MIWTESSIRAVLNMMTDGQRAEYERASDGGMSADARYRIAAAILEGRVDGSRLTADP